MSRIRAESNPHAPDRQMSGLDDSVLPKLIGRHSEVAEGFGVHRQPNEDQQHHSALGSKGPQKKGMLLCQVPIRLFGVGTAEPATGLITTLTIAAPQFTLRLMVMVHLAAVPPTDHEMATCVFACSISTPLVIVTGRRIVLRCHRVGVRVPVDFDVTDVAIYKAH